MRMALPIDTRKKPTDVKVHVSTGAGVDITWADGHTSHYAFDYLRDACPCASCNEERRKKAEVEEAMGAGMAAGGLPPALPMFKPKPKARAAKPIGHYALQMGTPPVSTASNTCAKSAPARLAAPNTAPRTDPPAPLLTLTTRPG
jgi:hypothetical protein